LSEKIEGETQFYGWVSSIRDLGNIKFIILRNSQGLIQIILKKGMGIDLLLELVDTLHLEDVIEVKGSLVKHQNAPGGFEVHPTVIKVINKSETPLPMSVSGKIMSNLDTRLDWRVLDLRKPKNIAIFKIKQQSLKAWKNTFESKNTFKSLPRA